ncbi:MAG: hypothetical protein ACRENG_17060 [bacterium]
MLTAERTLIYRNSTDGANWSTPVRLSAGDEQIRFPLKKFLDFVLAFS